MSLTHIDKTGVPQVIPASAGPLTISVPIQNQAAQRAQGRYPPERGGAA